LSAGTKLYPSIVIPFIAVIITISGLIHWFLYARLVMALEITSPALLWPLRIVAVLLALSYLLVRVSERFTPEPLSSVGEWTAATWIGVMFELLWMTLVLYLLKVVFWLTGIWGRFAPDTVTLMGRWSVIAVASAAILLCGYAMYRATRPACVAHATVPVKNFRPELQNLTIAMAADFHAGPLVDVKQVRRMARQIVSSKPDLILLPGDVLDHTPSRIRRIADAFRELHAPLGVYATTGNHEYYINVREAVSLIEESGIRVLNNEAVTLPQGLVIAGIADRTALQFRIPRPTVSEFVAEQPDSLPVILLNHTPMGDEASAASEAGVDLIVSGHTHAGQIWPFSIFTKMAFTYHHGLYKLKRGYILTTAGIGTWGPPMRLGAPPEFVLIKLVSENEPAQWSCD
jgi:hypothetical protein